MYQIGKDFLMSYTSKKQAGRKKRARQAIAKAEKACENSGQAADHACHIFAFAATRMQDHREQ